MGQPSGGALVQKLPAIGTVKMTDRYVRDIRRLGHFKVQGDPLLIGLRTRAPVGDTSAGFACIEVDHVIPPAITGHMVRPRQNHPVIGRAMGPDRAIAPAN